MAEQTGDAGCVCPGGDERHEGEAGEPAADCSTPAAPGSAEQQRRSLPNPFEARSGGKKQPHTLKWAVFEVLRDYPAGLGLADIVRLVEERKLRSFAKTNPAGQAIHQAIALQMAPESRILCLFCCHCILLLTQSAKRHL